MLERSPYPLLALKLLGTVCPCLEKEEDGAARRAAWALSSTPVRWHRHLRGESEGGAAKAVGGFVSGLFGAGSSGGGSLGGGDVYEPVAAVLSVADSARGPQLVVAPSGMSMVRKKSIPLRLIKKAEARKGGIISSASRSGIKIIDRAGRKVIKFDVLQSSSARGDEEEGWEDEENGEAMGGRMEDADESTRDDIIDQLEILIEWERRRQAYIVTLGEEDAENDDETLNEYDDDGDSAASSRGGKVKGAIAEKAAQIKHFAQREIEMQKMKKDRENRKAKYVKEAGGLKYTAIAMANRS
ncbi:hypothetical protein ACHAXT_012834 [Thalassiosira profunda]